MFQRWLKPVFVFCTQEAAKALIGLIVMAAVPVSFLMGLFSCQRSNAPTPPATVSQAAPASLPATARPASPDTSDGAKAHAPAASPVESSPLKAAPPNPTATAAPTSDGYFSITLAIPTRYRDLQILVDGEPARITDRQLSLIKLQVPRKSTPVRFTLKSNLLSQPREFTLQIERDNFEYSPFQ